MYPFGERDRRPFGDPIGDQFPGMSPGPPRGEPRFGIQDPLQIPEQRLPHVPSTSELSQIKFRDIVELAEDIKELSKPENRHAPESMDKIGNLANLIVETAKQGHVMPFEPRPASPNTDPGPPHGGIIFGVQDPLQMSGQSRGEPLFGIEDPLQISGQRLPHVPSNSELTQIKFRDIVELAEQIKGLAKPENRQAPESMDNIANLANQIIETAKQGHAMPFEPRLAEDQPRVKTYNPMDIV